LQRLQQAFGVGWGNVSLGRAQRWRIAESLKKQPGAAHVMGVRRPSALT